MKKRKFIQSVERILTDLATRRLKSHIESYGVDPQWAKIEDMWELRKAVLRDLCRWIFYVSEEADMYSDFRMIPLGKKSQAKMRKLKKLIAELEEG
jgi:hypothetical protein